MITAKRCKHLLAVFILLTGLVPAWSAPFDEEASASVGLQDTSGGADSPTLVAPPGPAGTSLLFRVAAYNIAHARGNQHGGLNELGRMKNLRGIADLLLANKVDIVGLTEISKGDLRAEFLNQPKYIANRLLAHYVYAENVKKGWFGILATQGNAIVSRYPILSSVNHKLYRSSDKHEQRSCLEGLIDMGNGKRLRFFVAHLSTDKSESDNQVEEIYGFLEKAKEPVILVGDFNLRPTYAPIKWLSERMRDTTVNLNTTYMNKPDIKIDYHFTRGEISNGKAAVLGFTEGYSDHGCVINDYLIRLDP